MRQRWAAQAVLFALAIAAVCDVSVAASPATYRYDAHRDFRVFLEDFRRAVLADDRAAVVRMTELPFRDFGLASEPVGTSCDHPYDECTAEQGRAKRTGRTADDVLERYARIVTPAVREALAKRRIHAADAHPHPDDDGPIVPGEYLLEADDIDDQRVFARSPRDGRYRMARIPFYP